MELLGHDVEQRIATAINRVWGGTVPMSERQWHQIRVHPAWQYTLAGVGRLTGAWGHRTIVLLSSHRFGSSLMVNYLSSQPNIRPRGEILNPRETVYGNFQRASQGRVLVHIKSMCFAPPGRIAMVKLMDSQIENHRLTLEHIIAALNRPYIVAVYRRDLLSAYVSFRIARQNGIWYSTDRVNDLQISVELAALKNYVRGTRRRWMHNSARLRTYDRAVIVAYEDLSEHPERAVYDMLDFIGVPRVAPISTDSVRQNPAPLSHKIENYRELGLEELMARGEFTLDLDLEPIGSDV
jgi:hypothetical protein